MEGVMELVKVERMKDQRVKVEMVLTLKEADLLIDKVIASGRHRGQTHTGPNADRCPACNKP
jgi:hypothetical protein